MAAFAGPTSATGRFSAIRTKARPQPTWTDGHEKINSGKWKTILLDQQMINQHKKAKKRTTSQLGCSRSLSFDDSGSICAFLWLQTWIHSVRDTVQPMWYTQHKSQEWEDHQPEFHFVCDGVDPFLSTYHDQKQLPQIKITDFERGCASGAMQGGFLDKAGDIHLSERSHHLGHSETAAVLLRRFPKRRPSDRKPPKRASASGMMLGPRL